MIARRSGAVSHVPPFAPFLSRDANVLGHLPLNLDR
jgi:hypothetical protein